MAKSRINPTPDQIEIFAQSYIKTFNATEAAAAAGYKGKNIRRRAYELMQLPAVEEAIRIASQQRKTEVKLEAAEVLKELKDLVFFDPRKLLNEDGSPKAIKDLDDATAKAIAGLDIAEIWEDKRFVGYVKKYKLATKLDAIDKALRHLGQYKDKVEHSGTVSLENLVAGSMEKKDESSNN
jgi:phage terminase small subunit